MKVECGFTRDYAITTMRKDIIIKSAIFDLIDNSIDAAENLDRVKNHKIVIDTKKNSFSIKDNCGGIEPELIEHVFKIGRREDKANGFGVGMKRAIIKLGNNADIFSYNIDKSYYIPFNVYKWGKDDNWILNIKEIKRLEKNKPGVEIYIKNLEEDVKKYFVKNECNNLNVDISRRYRMILNKGMKIILNNRSIEPYNIKEYKPIISPIYFIENKVNVQVKIYSNIKSNEENGWDIFVNNRCISERNRSEDVQWYRIKQESGFSYRRFIGEVLIEGIDVRDIPLNSSKDKIDFNSDVMNKIMRLMYSYLFENKHLFKKNDVTIQFTRDVKEVDVLKDHFNEKTAKAVGEYAFDKALGSIENKKK